MRVIVVFSLFASILLLGTSGIVQQSSALVDEAPSFRGKNCALTYDFRTFGNPGGLTDPGTQLPFGGTCIGGTLNTDPLVNDAFCIDNVSEDVQASGGIGGERDCHVHVPNFDDPFNTKLLRIQVFWTGQVQPVFFNVKPLPNTSDDCIFERQEVLGTGHFYEDYRCHPNPDNDRIWFTMNRDTFLTQVIVDSISFDRQAVGGELIPLDSTMVLVAGTHSVAAWMIPVIVSGIGFAIVIARKF